MATVQDQVSLPRTYQADGRYTGVLAAVVAIGAVGASAVSIHHEHTPGVLLWVLDGLYLLVFAVLVTLRVRIDGEGLLQRWLFTSVRFAWKEVRRVQRTRRGYAVLGADNRELALLSFLPAKAQQTIAEESVRRGRLKKRSVPEAGGVLELWER